MSSELGYRVPWLIQSEHNSTNFVVDKAPDSLNLQSIGVYHPHIEKIIISLLVMSVKNSKIK